MRTELTASTRHGEPPASDIATMPGPGDGAGVPDDLETAVLAARDLLAGTVEKIHPGTSARSLFAYVTQYRARLADLVAACPVPGEGDGA